MKKFENFLKEDPNKPIKQFGDNVTSSARVKATGDIIKSGTKATASQKKIAKDVLGNLNRFFSDKPDSETLKTKPTGDEKTFKTDKTKPTSSVKSKPVEPLAKRMAKAVERGIKSGDIPQDALVRKPNKPKPKPKTTNVVKPDKFTDVVKKFQGSYKDVNKIKKIPANEVKPVVPKKDPSFKISGTTNKTTPPSKPTFTKTDNPTFRDFKKRGISFDIKKPTTVVNPVNLSKGPSLPNFVGTTKKGNVVTQSTSSALPSAGKPKVDLPNFVKNKSKPNLFKQIIKRGAQETGLIDKTKDVKPFTRTTNTITTNVGKVKPSRLGKYVRGAGRVIAPIYAIKDYVDTTKKTRAQGYSKTYSRAKGLTRALSGYIGGGIGATIGSGVGLGIPGGIAGGVTGYNIGQRIGDKAFDYGQKVVTGKKTFKDIRKDINANVGKLFKPSADR